MSITIGPCVEFAGYRNRKGYGQVKVGGRKGKGWLAHRLAWAKAHGDPGPLCVLHRCDNPACINVEHLFLGTKADNNADMIAKGRYRGRMSRLTEQQIEAIRQDRRTQRTIATDYGIAGSYVSMIKGGKRCR